MYARMSDLAEKVTAQLSASENEEDSDMDINKFKELWHEMRKELQDNDASAYSEEARKWAVDNGIIQGGMIPKVDCCVHALHCGVHKVFIIDGRVPHSIIIEILTDEGMGTMFIQ